MFSRNVAKNSSSIETPSPSARCPASRGSPYRKGAARGLRTCAQRELVDTPRNAFRAPRVPTSRSRRHLRPERMSGLVEELDLVRGALVHLGLERLDVGLQGLDLAGERAELLVGLRGFGGCGGGAV